MKIVLVKAAEPDFRWERSYTPEAFAKAQRAWESTPVSAAGAVPIRADGYRILTAASLHAKQTAEAWFRDHDGRSLPYETTRLLDEIPLIPFADEGKAYPPGTYIRRGRRQWKRGDAGQPESRTASKRLANLLLEELEAGGEDVVLISHERRILLLLEVLRERKYQIRRGSLFRLESLERILAAKQILTCGGCGHNCQLSHPGCGVGEEKARQARMK